MNKIGKILLVGVGALAVWYVPTLLALQNLSFKFGKLRLTGFRGKNIQLAIELLLKNVSAKDLVLQYGLIEIYLNNTMIGLIDNPVGQIIKGNAITPIILYVDISPETTGTVIYNSIISDTFFDFQLVLRGMIKVNYKTLPVNAIFTKKDIEYAFS